MFLLNKIRNELGIKLFISAAPRRSASDPTGGAAAAWCERGLRRPKPESIVTVGALAVGARTGATIRTHHSPWMDACGRVQGCMARGSRDDGG